MALNGQQLLQGFSEFIDDWEARTTDTAGNTGGTTLVDTGLGQYGDNRLNGRYLRSREGATINQVRKILTNTQSSGTVTVAPAFSAQIASGIDYEIHKYLPARKFLALDKARLSLIDYLFKVVLSDTITSDGKSNVYDLPTAVVNGPALAFIERPQPADVQWNFLSTPHLDATTKWTATSATRSIVERDQNDLLIPKYDQNCTKLVVAASTNGTLAQTVANMANSATAALMADRRMTFAMWVYATEASRVTLKLADDSGTTTGTAHSGLGWELLFVEKTIVGNNATTLTATLDVASGATPMTIYANRAWLYFGDKELVADVIYEWEEPFKTRVDNTNQHVILGGVPTRGRQVRLQGKAPLSELGTNLTTQLTNTMEVDANTAEILYAHAAVLLFRWEQIKTDSLPDVQARMAAVLARTPDLERTWGQKVPKPRFRSPFGF